MKPSTHCDGCGWKLSQPVPAGQVAYCARCWEQDAADARAERRFLENNHGPSLGCDLKRPSEEP